MHASNPGNNLHVSGLSSRVDTRDLEAAFAKVGRVSVDSMVMFYSLYLHSSRFRFKRHKSCTTRTPENRVASAS